MARKILWTLCALTVLLPAGYGLITFFQREKILALSCLAVWIAAPYLLYRNFALGTQAGLGVAPSGLVGISLVVILIGITIGLPIAVGIFGVYHVFQTLFIHR